MKIFSVNNRAELIVLVSILIIAIAIVFSGLTFFSKYRQYSLNVEDLEPKITRLSGLIASEEQLQVLEQDAINGLSDLVYPTRDNINTVGTRMQQETRLLFEKAGMNVTGSQIVPRKTESGFVRAGVNISISGHLDALEYALIQLEESRPVVFVEKIEIKSKKGRRRRGTSTIIINQVVDVRIQLTSFKMES